jgi:hypothetical protein
MEIEKGYYYHFKHAGSINDHAYYVLGTAMHTEDESTLVVYQPLYENTFLKEADFCVRPLPMFTEIVERDGATFPRFQKITDPAIIAELVKIREAMYN